VAIFYQHVGQLMWRRDGPRSIGDQTGELRSFAFSDIEPFLEPVDEAERDLMRQRTQTSAPTGFQVWGIPSGAEKVLQTMKAGDYLMLLEFERFRYVGQVIHRISTPCWDLSGHIWGEQRFPLIILLRGEMIAYSWSDFIDHFFFDPKYHMRGNTMRLADSKVRSSAWGSEAAFVRSLAPGLLDAPPGAASLTNLDPADADDDPFDPTSITDAREKVVREIRARRGQRQFRDALIEAYEGRCAITGCDVLDVLEAAHITPYQGPETNHITNGLLLRADLHTLFDTNLVAVDPETRKVLVSPRIEDLRYRALHGQPLRATKAKAIGPSVAALKQHRDGCGF
jgi:hypothetical protein